MSNKQPAFASNLYTLINEFVETQRLLAAVSRIYTRLSGDDRQEAETAIADLRQMRTRIHNLLQRVGASGPTNEPYVDAFIAAIHDSNSAHAQQTQ